MSFEKGFVEVTVEVVAAPGAFLSADPLVRQVAQNDLAVFNLTVSPKEGFAGPIYLRCVNVAPVEGQKLFSVNPIPPGGGESVLSISFPQVGSYPIGIEAVDALPEGEVIQ